MLQKKIKKQLSKKQVNDITQFTDILNQYKNYTRYPRKFKKFLKSKNLWDALTDSLSDKWEKRLQEVFS